MVGYLPTLVTQSYLSLCDLLDCSPPGSSVCGILQARIPEWVAISFCRRSSWPRNRTHVSSVSCIAGRFFTHWATGGARPSCLLTRHLQVESIYFRLWWICRNNFLRVHCIPLALNLTRKLLTHLVHFKIEMRFIFCPLGVLIKPLSTHSPPPLSSQS